MNLKKVIAIILILAGAAGAYYFFYAKNKAKNTSAAAQVLTARVERGDIIDSIKGSGTIQPYQLLELNPRGSGTVEKVYVKAGDKVKAGDPLLVLYNRSTDLALEKARINLSIQQDNMNKALSNLEKAEIKAPRQGIVTEILVNKGDSISKGTTVAKLRLNPGKTIIKAPFNAAQIKDVKIGDKAEVLFLDSLFKKEGIVTDISEKGKLQSTGAVYYYATIEIDGEYYVEGAETLVDVTVHTRDGVQKAVETVALEAPEEIEVKSEAAGTVSAIYVKEDQTVSAGAKLVSLDSEELKESVESAKRSLEQAKLDLEEKELAKNELVYTAPFDGTIVEVNVSEGEELVQSSSQSSSEPLIILADYSKMKVVISVDELDAVKIKEGMPVKITSDAFPGKSWQGTVENVAEIGTSSDDVSTFDVTIVTSPIEELKAGMTVTAEIIVQSKEDTLILPASAIREANGRTFVLLRENEGEANGQSRRQNMKEVKLGIKTSEYVEILEGLSEGDEVIIPTSSTSGQSNRQGNTGGFRFNLVPGGPPPGPRQ
ncbi:efflux RND transporter periplasmic adaptor subunit [Thermovorax subterraneus]|nr:efflux RND transporter periplasmic adaptor subunit [Thermovorax subterraneus]